jgi:hypothetical protein
LSDDADALLKMTQERDFWRAKFEELRPLTTLLDQSLNHVTRQFVEPDFEYVMPTLRIPDELYDSFTMKGRAEIVNWDEFYPEKNRGLPAWLPRYHSQTPRYFSYAYVAELIENAHARETKYYGIVDTWLYELLDAFPIKGQSVAIMGSLFPWYEAITDAFGGTPHTFEYNTIYSDHPLVQAIKPQDFVPGSQLFDAAISISSFEHDGLGFYGDPIDPDGDLKAMANMRKIVKPGGLMYFCVPVGKDSIVWPMRRNYGHIRFPMMTEGWNILDSRGHDDSHFDVPFGGHHSVWVLENAG